MMIAGDPKPRYGSLPPAAEFLQPEHPAQFGLARQAVTISAHGIRYCLLQLQEHKPLHNVIHPHVRIRHSALQLILIVPIAQEMALTTIAIGQQTIATL